MKYKESICVVMIGLFPFLSQAGYLSKYECDIDSNTTVNQFKNELYISEEPTLMFTENNRPPNISDQQLMAINKQYFRFENYGIWVFFDMQGRFKSLRFEAPFAGTIGGVYIGDSMEELILAKGKPASNDSNGIIYRSAGSYVNYKTLRGKIHQAFTDRCD